MAEEVIETKVEETAEVVAESTENKKESGKNSRKPRRENRRPEKVSDGLEKRMVNLNVITKVTKGGKTSLLFRYYILFSFLLCFRFRLYSILLFRLGFLLILMCMVGLLLCFR